MVRSKGTELDTPILPVPSEIWKVREVMKFLEVSREEVYRLIHEEGFPATRIGNAFCTTQPAVALWLEQRLLKRKR